VIDREAKVLLVIDCEAGVHIVEYMLEYPWSYKCKYVKQLHQECDKDLA